MIDNIYNDNTVPSNVASFDVDTLGVNTTVSLAGDFANAKAAVAAMIEAGNELAEQQAAYKEQYVVSGHKALYKQLENIYSYALRIDSSSFKQKILDGLRKNLKNDHDVKVTKKTPWMTIVVKTVVRSDRQTAGNYSRVLQVAFDSDVAENGLVTFIENRGGMSKVKMTDVALAAQKAKDAGIKGHVDLLRDTLIKLALVDGEVVTMETGVRKLPVDPKMTADRKEGTCETGEFVTALLYHDTCTDEYRLAGAFDFGRKFEEVILRHIAKRSVSIESLIDVSERLTKALNERMSKMDDSAEEAIQSDECEQ